MNNTYNYLNRKSLTQEHIMVTSIDRIKFSYQINNKFSERFSFMSKDYRKDERFVKGKPLDIGIYVECEDRENHEKSFFFVKSLPQNTSYEIICSEIKTLYDSELSEYNIKYPESQYEFKNIWALHHHTYFIHFKDYDVLINKKKNYLTFEINDSFQNKEEISIYEKLEKVLWNLFKTEILIPSADNSIDACIAHILEVMSFSEIEIAFDFNPLYSQKIKALVFDQPVNAYRNELIQYEDNTFYHNTPKKRSGKSKSTYDFKFYNKEKKDFFDFILSKGNKNLTVDELEELFQQHKKEHSIDNDHDIFRFEITVKRDRLKNEFSKISSKEFFSQKHSDIISHFKKPCTAPIKRAFDILGDDFVNELVTDFIHTTDNSENLPKFRYKKELNLFYYYAFQIKAYDLLL
jgi:hypothetical protein